jgi:hypothetical protein
MVGGEKVGPELLPVMRRGGDWGFGGCGETGRSRGRGSVPQFGERKVMFSKDWATSMRGEGEMWLDEMEDALLRCCFSSPLSPPPLLDGEL